VSKLKRRSLCFLFALASYGGTLGCSRAEPDPHAQGASTNGRPALEGDPEPPKRDRELTAKEMPLTDDFRKAAVKLVTADNYRDQIARVERELAQLAQREERQRQLDADEAER
jgi:hypothetical protein